MHDAAFYFLIKYYSYVYLDNVGHDQEVRDRFMYDGSIVYCCSDVQCSGQVRSTVGHTGLAMVLQPSKIGKV